MHQRACPCLRAGGKVSRHAADRAEEGQKKKAAPTKKGKQARVWDDAGGARGKGEARGRSWRATCG